MADHVLLGLQLLGLLPVSVDHLPLRGDVARFSWSRVFYSVLLIISYCVILCYWLWKVTDERDIVHQTTYKITSFCALFSTFIGGMVPTCVAAARAKQKILLVEKLREVDFLLQHKVGPSRSRMVSLLILGFTIALVFLQCFDAFAHGFSSTDQALLSTYFYFMRMVILFALVEVMEVVLTVRERFQLVNERVLEVVARSRSKQLMWTVALPCVETFTMPQKMKMSIPSLSEIHWSLCCIVYDINSIYGSQLVTAMIFIFSHLVFYPYFIFILFDKFLNNFKRVGFSTMWTLLFVIELYVLVWPCSLTVKEAKKTVVIVTKLMGNKMAKPLFKELEIFADQLFHRDVEFTACGLFTLHTSIIISVASAVTTYMAIIIQFQTSSDDDDAVTTTETLAVNASTSK